MLKKVVGFICEVDDPFDSNIMNGSFGGSETWIFKMAEQFMNNGYHVIIFNNLSYNHIYMDMEFVQLSYLDDRLSYQYFTHIFINRQYNPDIIDLIKKHGCCDNVYFIAHDLRVWKNTATYRYIDDKNTFVGLEDIHNDEWSKKHIHNLFVMSDWHKEYNLDYYDPEFIKIIGNGIHIDNISNDNRDNNILWSSCYNRGLDVLVEKIAPIILEHIPDFKIYTCSYSQELQEQYNNLPYIINLGKLSKEQLYNEMRKHKVTFLPLTHWETFCITILENILNDVEVVCPFKYGIKTTMKYFESLLIEDGDYNDIEYCNYVADNILNKINNYHTNQDIRTILKSYISDNYSWEMMFNKLYNYIKLYETDNSNN